MLQGEKSQERVEKNAQKSAGRGIGEKCPAQAAAPDSVGATRKKAIFFEKNTDFDLQFEKTSV